MCNRADHRAEKKTKWLPRARSSTIVAENQRTGGQDRTRGRATEGGTGDRGGLVGEGGDVAGG